MLPVLNCSSRLRSVVPMRSWLTVGIVLSLLGIEYSRNDLQTEPLGHLVGLLHVDKQGDKVTRVVEIRIASGSFEFNPDRNWKVEDVLRAKVVKLRITSAEFLKDRKK